MEIQTEILVDAPAAEAWRVLGQNFAAIGQWSATFRTSSLEGALGVGAIRTCEGVGFGPFPPSQVTEKLTRFDPEAMCFAYVATSGLPSFIEEASNVWSIDAMGPGKCRVRSCAEVRPVWWLRPLGFLIPLLAQRDMDRFSEELQYQIERGSPHPRKIAMMDATTSTSATRTTSSWFWFVSIVALIWGMMGSGVYLFESFFRFTDPQALPSVIGQENAAMVLARPMWVIAMYGLLTLGGLIGSVLLLLRKRWAIWSFEGSLLGALALQFYWWTVIDIARDWAWPVGIAAFAAFLAWFAYTAGVRGWLGKAVHRHKPPLKSAAR